MYLQIFSIITTIIIVTESRVHNRAPSNLGIVGGEEKHISQAPWLAIVLHERNLSNNTEKTTFCGGSIISKKIVLTAAHCIKDADVHELFVRVGSNYIYHGGLKHSLKAFGIHPRYNKTQNSYKEFESYDIGIIWLQKQITKSPYVKCVAMPGLKYTIPSIKRGLICGFGKTSYSSELAYNLNCINITIASCQLYFGITVSGPNNVACGGSSKKNICNGDSGNGLIIKNKLVGLAEGGLFCGKYGFPSIFVKINTLQSWIDESSYTFNSTLGSYLAIIRKIRKERINVKFSYSNAKQNSSAYSENYLS